jgi:membrane-associated phospholipid phosphatase
VTWPTRIIVLLCLALPVAVFAVVAIEIAGGHTPHWDRVVLRFAYAHEHDGGIWRLANGWAAPGDRLVVGGVLVVLSVTLLAARRPRSVLFLLVAVGTALALETGLKHAFARPALFAGAASFSFPSGHAIAATAIAAVVAYVLPNTLLRIVAALVGAAWAIEVGVAAVVQHAHYPSDVVGGWTLALAWVTALWLLARRRLSA